MKSRMVLTTLLACLLALALAPAAAAQEDVVDAVLIDTVGLVDTSTGQWHLRDAAGNETTFYFGIPGDVPVMGDWDCDGVDTPGMYRRSTGFMYLRNSNTTGSADVDFFYGNPDDLPLAGDWDGNGCDTPAIYRPSEGKVYLTNQLGTRPADVEYYFGVPGDKPYAGDFDADGIDEIGLHRESNGFAYFRLTHTQGFADVEFFYGNPGDRILAGDWTGDGTDTVAIFRPLDSTFHLSHENQQGPADEVFTFGTGQWLPVGGARPLLASMTGDNEVPPSGSEGTGMAWVTFSQALEKSCFHITVEGLEGDVTAGHIHSGAAGEAPPNNIVVSFQLEDGDLSKCVDADATIIGAILDNPAGYYVNVHTGPHPAGEVRGQLSY
jgi:hypothetical protein